MLSAFSPFCVKRLLANKDCNLDMRVHRVPVYVLRQITVLGTPAEEAVGGKVDLINAGAFADVDLVLMAHPAQKDAALQPTLAVLEYVSFSCP